MKCLICEQELKSNKSYPGHLSSKHNMSTKDYYDQFFKSSDEGICICGQSTRFVNISIGYKQFCSLKCASPHIQEQNTITLKNKYDVTNVSQIPEVKEKIKQTMRDKYDSDWFCTTEKCLSAGHTKEAVQKMKKTTFKHFSVNVGFQTKQCISACHTEEANIKRKMTNLKRYSSEYTFKNNHTEEANSKRDQTNIAKFGYKNNVERPEIQEKSHSIEAIHKRHNTRKKNGWCRSRIEESFIDFLETNNINYIHNYKSTIYPYKCDFYLPDKNLYIEINAFWGHNNHFYDESNLEDIHKKEIIEQKALSNQYYEYVLTTWTIKDLEKRDTAIKNKLNYIVVWNKEQVLKLSNDLLNNVDFIGFIDYNL